MSLQRRGQQLWGSAKLGSSRQKAVFRNLKERFRAASPSMISPHGRSIRYGAGSYGQGYEAGHRFFVGQMFRHQSSTRNRSSAVRFSVYGDGRMLAETGPISFGAAAVPISADLGGAKTIELIARSGDGGASTVSVAWSMARMTK